MKRGAKNLKGVLGLENTKKHLHFQGRGGKMVMVVTREGRRVGTEKNNPEVLYEKGGGEGQWSKKSYE